MEQMRLNQEQLRDEIEIEITYEEGRRKELEGRYSQFIKQLDFMVATRQCNLKMDLDKAEKPIAPGMAGECGRCKERDQMGQQLSSLQ